MSVITFGWRSFPFGWQFSGDRTASGPGWIDTFPFRLSESASTFHAAPSAQTDRRTKGTEKGNMNRRHWLRVKNKKQNSH